MNNILNAFQVSPVQRRLITLREAGQKGMGYVAAVKMEGETDAARLQSALYRVIMNHDIFHTDFREHDYSEFVCQCIKEERHCNIMPVPLGEVNDEQLQEETAKYFSSVLSMLDEPAAAVVARILVTGKNLVTLVIGIPALMGDMVTLKNLVSKTVSLYGNNDMEQEEVPQFVQFSEWHNNLLAETDEEADAYWKAHYVPSAISKKISFQSKNIHAPGAPSVITVSTGSELFEQLLQCCKKQNISFEELVLGCWTSLLYKHNREEQVVIGKIEACRSYEEFTGINGPVAQTLPVTIAIKETGTVMDIIQQAGAQLQEIRQWQDNFLMDDTVDLLQGRYNFFTNGFQYENTAAWKNDDQQGAYHVTSLYSNADRCVLRLFVVQAENNCRLSCYYETANINDEAVNLLLTNLEEMLVQLVNNPGYEIAETHALLPSEKELVLAQYSKGAGDLPVGKLLPEAFEEQVKYNPGSIAVACGNEQLSYAALNSNANQLANYLINEYGAQPGDRIAVQVPRSTDLIVAMLGIIKAGCSFIPVDIKTPSERLQLILENSAAKVLIRENDITLENDCCTVLVLSDKAGVLKMQAVNDPGVVITPATTCYTIYTSGSTGVPKGVDVTHGNLANYLSWFVESYHITAEDKTLVLSSVAFDLAYTSLWSALYKGAALHLLPGEDWVDPLQLLQLLEEKEITYLKLTPAHLQLIVNSPGFEAVSASLALRLIVVGGEAINPTDIEKYISLVPSCLFVNHYGPTETTIGTIVKNIDTATISIFSDRPVIGRPISNARAYILDEGLQPVPAGIAGELCIAGPGLAKGYVGNEALTNEKFIHDTFSGNDRIYRTGDLARWIPGGDIEFIGRKDFQVKIRGYRVEPGEVEHVLRTIDGIENAIVVAADVQNSTQLVAYYTGNKLPVSVTIQQVEKKLPAYMVPSMMLHLQQFPLTPNGKIDRKQLPHPGTWTNADNKMIQPSTPREKTFAAVWGEVLKYGPVSILDNFFSKGGDSIKAILMVSKLGIEGYVVSVFDVFKYATVQELAAQSKTSNEINKKEQELTNRLSPVQSEFLYQYKGNVQHFNQSIMLKGKFDPAVIQQSLQVIVRHHDAFRLVFTRQNEQWLQQYITGEMPVIVEEADLREEKDPQLVLTAHANKLQASFSLSEGPLLKAGLYHMHDGDRLLIVAHHLVMDGVSWRILLADLELLLAQLHKNEAPVLPAASDTYLHWVSQVHKYAAGEQVASELSYWKGIEQSAANATVFKLANTGTVSREAVSFSLPAEVTTALLSACTGRHNATPLQVLLSALSQAFSQAGWNKTILAMEGHGREDIMPGLNISRTIGWFTSIYPVMIENGPEQMQQLLRIKNILDGIPQKGLGYGMLKYISQAQLDIPSQVCFNYLGQFDGDAENKTFEIAGEDRGQESEPLSGRYALQITALISNGSLYVEMDADTSFFTGETMARLLQDYRMFLLRFEDGEAALENSVKNAYTINSLTDAELLALYKKYDAEDICPLSPLQQGLFFHWRHGQHEDPYFRQFTYRVKGNLDPALVKKAFDRLMMRYDILRAVFDDEVCTIPVQVILRKRPVGFTYADLSSTANKEEAVLALRQEDRQKGFRLDRDVLMRISVYRLEEKIYEINWSYHHIIMDGWSSSVIAGEFFALYESLQAEQEHLLPVVSQYREYIQWMQQQDAKEAISSWKNYLEGYDEVAALPIKKDNRAAIYEPGRITLTLPAETTQQLVKFAAGGHFTLNAFMQVAWGILLGRYTMRNDVVFGSVVSGRPAAIPGIENMVGLFINTVPVRIQMPATATIPELCRSLQLDNMRLQAYHHAQLADIQSATGFEKDLFDHFIGFENFPAGEPEEGSDENGLVVEQVANQEQTTFDLYITIVPGTQLEIYFSYNQAAYDATFIQDAANRLNHIISQCIGNPALTVQQIELLSPGEISAFMQPAKRSLPPVQDIVEQVRRQAVAVPGQTALLFNGQSVSYAACNDLSDRLANYLLQNGIQPGAMVAVWMRRSEWAVIAMLGILKAGAAFLPVDPSIPDQRVRYMLQDAEVKMVLTDSASMFRVMEQFQDNIMALDIQLPELEPVETALPVFTDMDQPAYVLFTSGSTGKPKGVVVSRANINYYLSWANSYYFADESGYPFALFTSLSFDLTLTSIFSTLMRGDAVHIFDEEDAHFLLKNIFDPNSGIRAVKLTPSHISILPHLDIAHTAISHAIVGGEQLTVEQVAILHSLNGAMRVFNEYGPTETTVGCSIAEISNASSSVSIGKPIEGAGMYIFNQYGRLQPQGIPGEIFIGGPGVAKGYLNQAELTAQRFVTDAYTGKKLYRTGDKAKWLADGNAEYMGRIDEQVKIRGYRVEPGEIAQVIASCTGVSNCIVLVQKDRQQVNALIAFVAAKENDMENIRQQAATQLPDYMVPSYFIPVIEIPLTANGKADRKVLLDTFNAFDSGNTNIYTAPVTAVQQKLAAIWEEVLDKEKIGISDNFFRLGGHSLKIVMVISRVHRELGVKLDMRLFFDHPSIEEVAAVIDTLQDSLEYAIPVVAEADHYEASPAQKRLWIINQLEKNNTAYNITGPILIEGKLNKPALFRAFKRLLERQESLRTTFLMENDALRQVIHPAVTFPFSIEQADLSGEENPLQKAQQIVNEEMNASFDLVQGPLFRVKLVQLQEEQHMLVLSMHHIISDGWSVDVLLNELSASYTAYVNGMEDALPALAIQYKDYAAWQNHQLQGDSLQAHQSYWHAQLAGELPVLELPSDFSLPQIQTFNGNTVHASFDDHTVAALKQIAEDRQSSLYMLLLASVKTLIWRYTGQQDMIVGMPVSGRSEGSLENLVGFFVNTLPLRTRFEAGDTFDTVLGKIKENVLDALAHQVYPFDKLVEDLAVKRNPGRSPVFDVVVALQNTGIVSGSRPVAEGITLKPFDASAAITKYHLLFNFIDTGSGLALEIQYNTDLFTETRILRMVAHLQQITGWICNNISTPIQSISYMNAQETVQVKNIFSNSEKITPVDTDIITRFGHIVSAFPDAVALVYDDNILTYRGLNDEVNKLATHLVHQMQVKQGDRIALQMTRTQKMIVAILAVLKAGAVYVPLDNDNPLQRDLYILDDASVSLLITDVEIEEAISRKIKILHIDRVPAVAGTGVQHHPNTPGSAAYIMYTSGSTGNPKGVLVPHKAVIRLVTGTSLPPTGAGQKSLLVSSYSFDGSVYSIFNTLLNGGALYVAGKETILSVHALTGYIRDHGITEMFIPTALFHLVAENEPLIGRYMQRIVIGGEEASGVQITKCLTNAAPGFELYNGYGPTENTVFTTVWLAVPGVMQVPIGKPIDNTTVYILDEALQPVPVGIDGELYAGGHGLSEGYLNQQKITEEKFITLNGERLYKTGDLARWTDNGEILFRGRKDHQVKVNGYRIEPGEIESVLRNHPSVENVAVAVRGTAGEKQLVAWLSLRHEESVTAIRTYLQEKLPSYMIPSGIFIIPGIPLNANGKIDFSKLPVDDAQAIPASVLPGTETEQKLAAIWNEVLMRAATGIHDDFFDIGGHSLKATQIIGRIVKQMAVHIDLRTFFANPTIHTLSRRVDEMKEKQFYSDMGNDGEEVEEFIF